MIVFFGSSEYSLPVLKSLLKKGERPVVISSPDRPAGRGQKLTSNPLAVFAQKRGLVVFKPENLRQLFPEKLRIKGELGLVCVYGKIIPLNWLEFFPRGILNIHPSLLPAYRGPAPAQFAILNQEKETGVTVIKMDEEIDHGPILWQKKTAIKPDDTGATLYQRLFEMAAVSIGEVIDQYRKNKIQPRPQDHTQASFSRHLTRKDGFISPEKIFSPTAPLEVDRKRRAFTPWPGVYTRVMIKGKEKILKIIQTHPEGKKTIIDRVQLEGKKGVTFSQFCAAYSFSF